MREIKPIIPTLGRLCFVSTFIEDGLRMVFNWSDQVEYIAELWGFGKVWNFELCNSYGHFHDYFFVYCTVVNLDDLRVPQSGAATGGRHVRADPAKPVRIRALERREQYVRSCSSAERHGRGERSGDAHLERQPRASRGPPLVHLSLAANLHVSAALLARLPSQVCAFGQHTRMQRAFLLFCLLFISCAAILSQRRPLQFLYTLFLYINLLTVT